MSAVLTYLKSPAFWAAVILVSVIANWAYMRFFGGKGKLV